MSGENAKIKRVSGTQGESMFDNKIKLSDLQLAVMKVLWRHGKLSVTDVHKTLNDERELAPTTVSTLLKRMQEKDWLGYEKDGRQFLYYPLITEEQVKTSMLGNMLRTLFDGRPEELVHHLVGKSDVDKNDLAKIQALLDNTSGDKGESK